jgi:WD40 repeat protein
MFELLRKFKTEHSTGVWAVATVSSSVAVSAGGESLKWWSLDNASLGNNNNNNSNSPDRTVPLAHRAAITSVATTRNKQFLATSSLDGHVKVWSTSDATELKDLHVGPLESWAVAFEASLPDDTPLDQLRLVTTCQSGASALSLWSLADAAKVATYNATASLSAAAVNVAVAYSPDGRLVASAAMDGSVSLFDANAGTKRHTFAAHSMAVRALAFSADSSTLITASDDAQIRVHDVESCSPIVSLSVRLQIFG